MCSANRHERNNAAATEERCFLCGPCRNVISRTSLCACRLQLCSLVISIRRHFDSLGANFEQGALFELQKLSIEPVPDGPLIFHISLRTRRVVSHTALVQQAQRALGSHPIDAFCVVRSAIYLLTYARCLGSRLAVAAGPRYVHHRPCDPRVEAACNTSIVALRVIGGDGKGTQRLEV
jgi:hypothetical protein